MELTIREREKFFKLVAEVRSPIYFLRELNLSPREVDALKQEYCVENPDDARRALRGLAKETEDQLQARMRDNIQKQREAEAVAQKRLNEFESKKKEEAAANRAANRAGLDGDLIRQEDAQRQRRLVEQQEHSDAGSASIMDWRLELDGRQSFDDEIIALFKNDLLNLGINFCIQKYGANSRELKSEADRLGVKLSWDTLRK
jgi:hypothetical protein